MPYSYRIVIAFIFGVYLFHPALHLLDHHSPSEVAVEQCVLCKCSAPSTTHVLEQVANVSYVDFAVLFTSVLEDVSRAPRSRGPPPYLA